jgi:hypothetical protein
MSYSWHFTGSKKQALKAIEDTHALVGAPSAVKTLLKEALTNIHVPEGFICLVLIKANGHQSSPGATDYAHSNHDLSVSPIILGKKQMYDEVEEIS